MMTLPPWEAVLLGAAAFSGPIAGYLLGRLHARFIQGEHDREHAFSALGGKADWEVRADEAERAAVEHAKQGRWFEAERGMDLALRIRKAHEGDR